MNAREKYLKYAKLVGADVAERRLNNFFDRVIRKELKPKEVVDLLSLKGKVKAIIDDLNERTGKRFSAISYPTRQHQICEFKKINHRKAHKLIIK